MKILGLAGGVTVLLEDERLVNNRCFGGSAGGFDSVNDDT